MNEICGDNRFEIIAKAKAHLLDATNIDTSEDEMKVLDNFLFRCWQMGWLDRYAEPNCSEKPNNSKVSEIPTSSTISKMEQVEPQTERIKTLDYCDICNHEGCDNCIANNLDDYCVPSGYKPITQTETQNSNMTFEKDECAKEYEELGLKELKELINADRKTENSSEKPTCEDCKHNGEKHAYDYACDKCTDMDKFQHEDEPQTDCPWK